MTISGDGDDGGRSDDATPRVTLKHGVFWPPFLAMLVTAGLNLALPEAFGARFRLANDWLLDHCGWLFVAAAFASLGMCLWVCVSPFARVRLGGPDATPLLAFWDWFAITLCTTIAVGILFWSTAEPVSHFVDPPRSLGLEPRSPEAARFALAALYLHWTFVPYAIYAAAGLVFAFAHSNMRLPYSLGSTLVPLLGPRLAGRLGGIVDGLCLFALVAGMSASLGTGILTIAGGLEEVCGIRGGALVWAAVAAAIVATFVVSSGTGLMKGIRILSDVNAKGLLLLGAVVFLLGPSLEILSAGAAALGEFARRFVGVGLEMGLGATDPWARKWSVFYWAVWLAWTPVTACFLGRIAHGRTVREFMLVNLLLPSLFCIAWMAVFGTTALRLEQGGTDLAGEVAANRYENVSYAVLRSLPGGAWLVAFYLAAAFVCFVTSADSNTSAMASISSRGMSQENPEGGLGTKVAWGLLVGLTAWAMITFANVDGIRYLSNLGGLPATLLVLSVLGSLGVIILRHRELDATGGGPAPGAPPPPPTGAG